jgi:hypothetical protein
MTLLLTLTIWTIVFTITFYLLRAEYIRQSFLIGVVYSVGILSLLLIHSPIILLQASPLLLTVIFHSLLFSERVKNSRLHPKYLINKFIEVAFQQIGVLGIFLSASLQFSGDYTTIIVSTALFVVLHLGLYLFFPWERATFFLVATILFGWIFFMALSIDLYYGFIFNFLFHYGNYFLLGIFMQKRNIDWLKVR